MQHDSIRALLPYLWLVWSDDLLTENEHRTLRRFIGDQNWLTAEQQRQLLLFADVNQPPSRHLLSEWETAIHETVGKNPDIQTLDGLAFQMSGKDAKVMAAQRNLRHLSEKLGLLDAEALNTFKSARNTFTADHDAMARFEVARVTDWLDGPEANTIRGVKQLLTAPEFAYYNGTDVPTYREIVLQWCQRLADRHLGNRAYPKNFGGGGNVADYFAIMETLSYHDLSLVIKFGVQFGLWGMSVYLLGTEKHHRKYLEAIGNMQLPGCFAMTESGHGSNVKGLETTASYNHDTQTFTINTPRPEARKEYIGNAAQHGRMATVFAQLVIDGKAYGVNAFIVPLRDERGKILEGIEIGDCGIKMGLNGVDNGTIRFNNVVIPKENMLDRFASVTENGTFESPIPSDNRRFFTMLGTLVGGRIGIPRSALSAAKSALAIAIRYADRRRQFGPDGGSEVPILNYRQHQRRLFPHLAQTYALHFALRHLSSLYIDRDASDMQEIEALAAGMKAYTTWQVRDALQECREACGGKGYLSENRIGALKNDIEIYTTFEGDNTVLMQLVAKNRLGAFRKQYGTMDAAGMVHYVWDKAIVAVTEKNPIVKRNTDADHLLDRDFHKQAFGYREKSVVESAALRLKKLIDSGLDAYDAFNVAQHQMMAVAESFLERVILEQFDLAVNAVSDARCQAALQRIYHLFALSVLEKHKGWYLEENYMEAVKTKAIRKMVNQLCWEIRPDAVGLVDAFDIPDACLAAPIAFRS